MPSQITNEDLNVNLQLEESGRDYWSLAYFTREKPVISWEEHLEKQFD